VSARYGGDSVFALPALPNPVSVNVTRKRATCRCLEVITVHNGTTGVLANGGTYPFGTSIAIDAQVVGVNAPPGSTMDRDRHRNFYRCGEYRHGEFRSAEVGLPARSVGAGRFQRWQSQHKRQLFRRCQL